MRTAVLVHGIRQLYAKAQMEPLAKELEKLGVGYHYANYGYVLIPTTNDKARQAVRNAVRSGEDVVAYSNGAWAVVEEANDGLEINHLYLIAPALSVDTVFPSTIKKITIFYGEGDKATPLGKLWRQATRILPWRWKNPHGWGNMGAKGPKRRDDRMTLLKTIPQEIGHNFSEHKPTVRHIAKYIQETAS